jgi:hypothetical protein
MGIVYSCLRKPKTTNHATSSITIPSSTAYAAPFRLLDLPVEVVARVIESVNNETLVSVRLTCKALEDITFDRFADENFAHIYCWVVTVDDFKRLKDILYESPRLSSKIKQLTLTTHALMSRTKSDMNYVLHQFEDEDIARANAINVLHEADDLSCAEVISVLRILQDV